MTTGKFMECEDIHEIVEQLNDMEGADIYHILTHLCDHQLESLLMMIADVIHSRGEEARQIISQITSKESFKKGEKPCH